MLVEGAAEVLLIPPLVKAILDIDLEREGISVIAIHGVHFDVFAGLFNSACLPKKCAIVADADLDPAEANELADADADADSADEDDDQPVRPDMAALENAFVKVFLGDTTFEREITTGGNLAMLEATARALGAPRIAQKLSHAGVLGADDELKDAVLRTAKRFGKGRFAQVAARHATQATELPSYIVDAVEWLRDQ
jgi:putative ATP-dependent endonuclease of OLD family